MCQQEIDALKASNLALQNQVNMLNLAASQTAQTAVKAVFPYAVIVHDKTHEMVRVIFSDEVWDSPYKGG